jgi:hypothetical protein
MIPLSAAPPTTNAATIWSKPDHIAMPATISNTDTSEAGTSASAIGIRRPARPISQRGNTSPQRCTKPSIRTAPTRAKVARNSPAVHVPRA